MNLDQALEQAITSLRFAEDAVRSFDGYPSEAFRRSRLDEVIEARRMLREFQKLTTGQAGARSRRDVSTGTAEGAAPMPLRRVALS